jgi:CysZ protein
MRGVFDAFPVALRSILRDPINLLLALIPTLLALAIYGFAIAAIFRNSDYLGLVVQDYLPDPNIAGWVGKLITALFVLFVFLIMSWTFVIVVGIISAPFNSMLSSRIETLLVGKTLEHNKSSTFKEMIHGITRTFKDEFQKLFFVVLLTCLALLLNLFPLFYPVGVFLLSLLIAVQFVDYSWSRANLGFGGCVQDVIKNLLPYAAGGFFFLILMTVPLINSLVPSLATGYFTVLRLYRTGRFGPSEPSIIPK